MVFSSRTRTAVVSLLAALSTGLSAQDSRNRDLPHTKYRFKPSAPASRTGWEKRSEELKAQILTAAGLDPMPVKNPLNSRVFGRKLFGAVAVEKVLLETMPGFFLAGNLYRPAEQRQNLPAVLTPHGHWKHGRLEDIEEYSVPALGYNLARLGFVVFAYDMVGYNDTKQLPHNFGQLESESLWGFHPLAVQTWNSIRALDFVAALPGVDRSRIAVTGASGGGTQSFILSAIDERVAASIPVNMISAHFQGGCDCENAPGLRLGTNNMEIAALTAPRPMLMVAATKDWTEDTPRIEHPAVKAIYDLLGAGGQLEMLQIDAPHNYNRKSREAAYRFLWKRLVSETRPCELCTEEKLPISNLDELRLLKDGYLPENALSGDAFREQWKEEARANALTGDVSALSGRLITAMAAEWPDAVKMTDSNGNAALTREGVGDRVPARWTPADKKSAVLIVHSDGSEAAQTWWQTHHQTGDTSSLLMIDAFQTGRAVAPKNGGGGSHHLTFNRTDDAQRVQDILTSLRWLQSEGYKEIRLVGVKKAAVWALFAAAVSPVRVTLNARLNGFAGTDDDFVRDFFVPGIQRAGGLTAALRLIRLRGVKWGEPHVNQTEN